MKKAARKELLSRKCTILVHEAVTSVLVVVLVVIIEPFVATIESWLLPACCINVQRHWLQLFAFTDC
jgi:hypothetical protein